MSESSELLQIVQSTISSFDTGNVKLSVIIRSCIRIARLRNDFVNLIWLQREIIDNSNNYERMRVFYEIMPHFTKEEFDNLNKLFLDMWIKERPAIIIEDGEIKTIDKTIFKNVSELENELEGMIDTYNKAQTPSGMHPLDTYNLEEQNFLLRNQMQAYINHYQKILEVIRNRVYDFLSQTEQQLLYRRFHADIFEQNRQYVELRLNQVCPEALKEFATALQRVNGKTSETRAQALLSCRRMLKDLADIFYPPVSEQVTSINGKTRDLSEEKYVNRLWQFVNDAIQNTTSAQLLLVSLEDLGHRIDQIYDFTNKGIHAEVTELEMNQCLMQTYLLIGDLLRIYDRKSAIELDSPIV